MKFLRKPIFTATTKKANTEMMFSIEEIVSLLSAIPELDGLVIDIIKPSKNRIELIIGEHFPTLVCMVAVLILGFVSYGLSINFYIKPFGFNSKLFIFGAVGLVISALLRVLLLLQCFKLSEKSLCLAAFCIKIAGSRLAFVHLDDAANDLGHERQNKQNNYQGTHDQDTVRRTHEYRNVAKKRNVKDRLAYDL